MTDDAPSRPTAHTFELIREYRAGKLEALNALFERYYPRVLTYVRARMGGLLRSKEESADLVQYTFAAALKDFDQFEIRDEGAFVHWLVTVAENQLRGRVDHWRAEQRDPALEAQLKQVSAAITSDVIHLEPVAPELSPAGEAEASEFDRDLAAALSKLSADHRDVILHRRIVGHSLEETRRRMGRDTVQAIAMLQARAQLELARIMGEKHDRADSA
jgi:RNA polymerase sigma factor (sigma-70 family)